MGTKKSKSAEETKAETKAGNAQGSKSSESQQNKTSSSQRSEAKQQKQQKPDDVAEGSPAVKQTLPKGDDSAEYEARVIHNQRTGGGKLQEGEVQRQRDEHNRRVGDR